MIRQKTVLKILKFIDSGRSFSCSNRGKKANCILYVLMKGII